MDWCDTIRHYLTARRFSKKIHGVELEMNIFPLIIYINKKNYPEFHDLFYKLLYNYYNRMRKDYDSDLVLKHYDSTSEIREFIIEFQKSNLMGYLDIFDQLRFFNIIQKCLATSHGIKKVYEYYSSLRQDVIDEKCSKIAMMRSMYNEIKKIIDNKII
jgi:hypothetical protein